VRLSDDAYAGCSADDAEAVAAVAEELHVPGSEASVTCLSWLSWLSITAALGLPRR